MSIPADQMQEFLGRPPASMPAPDAPVGRQPLAAEPYDSTQFIGELAKRTVPIAYQPYTVPQNRYQTGSAGGAGGAGGATASATPSYPEAVALLEKEKGGKLDETELYSLMDRYRENVVRLGNLQAGHEKYVVDGAIEAFGVNAEEYNRRYLLQAGEASPEAENTGTWEDAKGQIAALLGAVAKGGLKTIQFADDVGGIVPRAIDKGLRELTGIERPADAPGLDWVSNLAQSGIEAVDKKVAESRSAGQIALDDAQAKRFQELRDNKETTALDWAEAFLTSGNVIRGGVSPVIGELVIPGGILRKGKMAIQALPKAAQLATNALALGGPAAAGGVEQWKADTMATPLSEFGPQVREAYDGLVEAGIPKDQAEAAVKRTAIDESIGYVTTGMYAANAALSMIPGLGRAEAAVAGQLTRGVGKKAAAGAIAKGALEEGAEETAAGTIEQVALNQAENQRTGTNAPLTRNLTEPATMGAVLGTLVGGGVSALARPGQPPVRQPNPKNKLLALPAPPPGGTTSYGTTVPVPPAPTPAPAPGTAPAATSLIGTLANGPGVDDVEMQRLRTNIAEEIKAAIAPTNAKNKIKKYDADGLVSRAIEHAQLVAGDAWPTLSSEQKVDIIEAAILGYGKAKGKGVDTSGIAATIRKTAQDIMNPPQPTVTEVPLDPGMFQTPPAAPAAPPAPVDTQPAPAPVTPSPPAAPSAPAPAPPTGPQAQPPAPAPAPQPTAQPTTQQPTAQTARLPAELAKSSPGYDTVPALDFENDVDKAIYIATAPVKLDDPTAKAKKQRFDNWLVDTVGMTPAEIRARGKDIRTQIKGKFVKGATTLRVDAAGTVTPPAPAPAPVVTKTVVTAKPADTETGKKIAKAQDEADKAKTKAKGLPKNGTKKPAPKPAETKPAPKPAETKPAPKSADKKVVPKPPEKKAAPKPLDKNKKPVPKPPVAAAPSPPPPPTPPKAAASSNPPDDTLAQVKKILTNPNISPTFLETVARMIDSGRANNSRAELLKMLYSDKNVTIFDIEDLAALIPPPPPPPKDTAKGLPKDKKPAKKAAGKKALKGKKPDPKA